MKGSERHRLKENELSHVLGDATERLQEHRSTVMMGADFYESDADRRENARLGRPDVGIGPGSVIEGAIIDKDARIGRRVIIRMLPDRPDEEHENWVARDGIVIVPKNAIIPDGTVI